MRIIIAIESCHNHRSLEQAQRDTWIKDIPAGADYKFFLGNRDGFRLCSGPLANDEIQLPVEDGYDYLSLKTRDICRWAAYQGYDYLYKTDIDTLVSVPNLLSSGFDRHFYMGGFNEDDMPPNLISTFGVGRIQFASGGAGYWLNRDAIDLVADGPDAVSQAEDVYAAKILLDKYLLVVHNGYRWRPGETVDKEMVSLHLSSALQKKYESEDMFSWYEKMKQAQR